MLAIVPSSPYNPNSSSPYNPDSSNPYNPNSSNPYNPNSSSPYNPNSSSPYNPNSSSLYNPDPKFDAYLSSIYIYRRVWRYQRCNQNTYIEEEQTTQRPKQKVQKDKQRSTKHYTENYSYCKINCHFQEGFSLKLWLVVQTMTTTLWPNDSCIVSLVTLTTTMIYEIYCENCHQPLIQNFLQLFIYSK